MSIYVFIYLFINMTIIIIMMMMMMMIIIIIIMMMMMILLLIIIIIIINIIIIIIVIIIIIIIIIIMPRRTAAGASRVVQALAGAGWLAWRAALSCSVLISLVQFSGVIRNRKACSRFDRRNFEYGAGRFLRVMRLARLARRSLGRGAFRGLAPKGPPEVDGFLKTPANSIRDSSKMYQFFRISGPVSES